MKNLILVFLLIAIGFTLSGQSNIGLSLGSSKSDLHTESIWFQKSIAKKISLGLHLQNGGIRYRFINARAVRNGSAQHAGLVLGYNFSTTEKFRLDFNLSTLFRRISSDDLNEENINANGLEINPNILVGLRLNEKMIFHSGVMLRAALQFDPESIADEQLPSGILTNALTYQLNNNFISIKTYFGSMNGAGGDTEKFYRQISIGYQRTLSSSDDASKLPFFNF